MLNMGAYSISKYGVEGFSDALRREMRPWGVLVSIIAPGAFYTPIYNTKLFLERHRRNWDRLTSEVALAYGEKFFHDSK